MLQIGDKVKVKETFWKDFKKAYINYSYPNVATGMSVSIGKIFYIQERTLGKNRNRLYLLVNEFGETDGFAWVESLLEKVE